MTVIRRQPCLTLTTLIDTDTDFHYRWDAASGASRVDLHGGATSAYRMMLPDGRVQAVEVSARDERSSVLEETYRAEIYELCFRCTRTAAARVRCVVAG